MLLIKGLGHRSVHNQMRCSMHDLLLPCKTQTSTRMAAFLTN
jgi:hypothetical protein